MNRSRTTAVAVLSALSTVLLTAGPALARSDPNGPGEGADPGTGLSAAATIGLYLLVPLGIMATIAATVWLPGLLRGTRYRPAMGWDVAPVWFAGPPDPAAAVEAAPLADSGRGGGSGSW